MLLPRAWVVPFFFLFAAPVPADTVPLALHSHCRPGTFCNATRTDGTPIASFAEYRLMLLDSVQELNLQWKPTGISFFPLVLAVDSSEPAWYLTEGCSSYPLCADLQTTCFALEDCDGIGDGSCTHRSVCPDLTTPCSIDSQCPAGQQRCLEVNDQRRELWREQVAASQPSLLHVMLTEGPDRCCSHIPSYKPTSEPPCRRFCQGGVNGGQPCFGNADCPGSNCDGAALDTATNVLGVFCDPSRGAYSNGSIWAHELGHHFCLWHTFSFADSANVQSPPPNWDGDAVCDVLDTPEDPGPLETFNGEFGRDETQGGSILDNHEWCDGQVLISTGFVPLVDPGSPHVTFCQPVCRQKTGGVIEPLFLDPDTQAAMSYYGAYCAGPYIIDGVEYPALSPDSVKRIRDCRANQPARAGLPDVCAAQGGDTDRDGICDAHDNCPKKMNTAQRDGDGDGIGDVCDPCPADPAPTQDVDNDGIGDACDPDMDGDGCLNDVDQHRRDAMIPVGSFFNPFCDEGNWPQDAFEGVDHDGDGLRDCEDPDDDNDGICDESGPLPPGTPGTGPDGCVRGVAGRDLCPLVAGVGCLNMPAPGYCPSDWSICRGASCLDFSLTLRQVGDPDPEWVFERFDIRDEVVYVQPAAGLNLSQTGWVLKTLAPPNPASDDGGRGAGARGMEAPLVLEIRRKSTDEVVRTIAEYDRGDVSLGEVALGTHIAVIPDLSGGRPMLSVGSTFVAGLPPDVGALSDTDEDGWPDPFDNCVLAANAQQHDADGDGFGNRCDADLDGDAMTTAADIAFVAQCDGVDLNLELPLAEPADIGGDGGEGAPPFPAPEELARALACRAADLDEDFDVDPDDLQAAIAMDGQQPGPSAFALPDNPCEGVDCEDGNACTVDRCDPGSGVCVHVTAGCDDGDPCTDDVCDEGTGACVAVPRSCDDGNLCTRDSCDSATGCVYFPTNEGQACDDGDLCTSGGSCADGDCVAMSSVDCSDGTPCTVDACDPATGTCVYSAFCDDADACTADTCDPAVGCEYAPIAPGGATGLRFRTALLFEWDDDGAPPEAFNAYRGTLPPGGLATRGPIEAVYDHLCWDSRDSADDGRTLSLDASVPAPGEGFYYVISRTGPCGEGPPGIAPDGNPRWTPQPCPGPP